MPPKKKTDLNYIKVYTTLECSQIAMWITITAVSCTLMGLYVGSLAGSAIACR